MNRIYAEIGEFFETSFSIDMGKYPPIDDFGDELAQQVIPAPIVAPSLGYNSAKALYAIVRFFRPRRVLELGSGGGYSTWFITTALLRNGFGVGLSIDSNQERLEAAISFRAKGPVGFVNCHSKDPEFIKIMGNLHPDFVYYDMGSGLYEMIGDLNVIKSLVKATPSTWSKPLIMLGNLQNEEVNRAVREVFRSKVFELSISPEEKFALIAY